MYTSLSAKQIQLKNPFLKFFRKKEFLKPLEHPLYEFPFYVDIELTNDCNLNCVMCRRQVMRRQIGYMEPEVWKKIIDEISFYDCGIRFVRQGEPTLHPRLTEITRYANDKKVLNYISTNGFFSQEKMLQILMSRPDVIRFSFQGVDKQTFERFRIPSKYQTVVENIRLCSLKRQEMKWDRPFLIIGTTITKESDQDVAKFRQEWEQVVDLIEIGKTTFAWIERSGYLDKDLLRDENINRRYLPCLEVMTKLSINWNGDITACCADQDGELVLGNIKNMSLKEAWICEKEEYIRQMVVKKMQHSELPLCKDCFKGDYKYDYLLNPEKEK